MKLRHQILIPMGCVLLATVMVASLTDAWLAARAVRLRFQRQLLEIRSTLADAGFPPLSNQIRNGRKCLTPHPSI